MNVKTSWTVLGLALLLFGLYSLAREQLVPFRADYQRAGWRLTGDEPAYLLTAQAIASGDGENVRHMHEQKVYTNFQSQAVIGDNQWTWYNYVGLGVPHLLDRSRAWGDKQVIQRPPLIALFAAPFSLPPTHPRWSILFAQGLVLSLFAALFVVAVGYVSAGRLALGAFAALAFLGGMPIVYYSAQIYPEALTGALLAMSLLLARKPQPAFRALGYLLMFTSLWGSARVIVGIAAVSLIYFWREIRARQYAAGFLLAAGWLAYEGYNLWLWGHVVPPNPDSSSPLTLALLPRGFMMNLLSNDVGLLFLCPAAVAGLAALVLLLWRHPRDPGTLPAVVLFLGVAAVVSCFPNYRAGTCPAGRYQVAQSFLLLVPVLIFLAVEPADSRWFARVRLALLLWGGISLAMGVRMAGDPRAWFQHYHPLFRLPGIQPYYSILPEFRTFWHRAAAAWILVFTGSLFLDDLRHLGRWKSLLSR